jgi:hypothetical protein
MRRADLPPEPDRQAFHPPILPPAIGFMPLPFLGVRARRLHPHDNRETRS